MKSPVTSSVIQPPARKRTTVVTPRMRAVTSVPTVARMNRRRQCCSLCRLFHQCRTMPAWLSVKVANTLIEYMTTSSSTAPRV